MRDIFFFYLHSSFVEIEQSLDFVQSFDPASQLPSVLLDRIFDFLQSDSRTKVFDIVIHTVPQTEPFRYYLDNYCCMRILRMVDSCPNFSLTLTHKLATCLLGFG
jgi:hypothetical protein